MGYIQAFKRGFRVAKLASYRLAIFAFALLIASASFFYSWQAPKKVHALDTSKMLLFWDGGAAPTGWTDVSSDAAYSSKFLRGEAPANVLQTGSGAHSPTFSSQSQSYVAASSSNQAAGSGANLNTHTHTLSGNASAASTTNNPAHRTLKLIRYDTGIPSSIPGGAIALFDANPGAGWTRESAQDNLMLKVGTSVGSGGSDTHTHTITWPSFNASGSDAAPNGTGWDISSSGHTHSAPSNSPTNDSCSTGSGCMPPYVKPLLYKANSTIAAPDGLIALFDANPGGGWAVQSNPGGIFYQQFMRPASAFDGTSVGSATHSHAAVQSGNAGLCTSCSLVTGTGPFPGSPTDHTHKITVNFTGTSTNLPDYVNVVVAKKSLPSMMLFWDGSDGSIPAGWSKVNDFNGRFPRGDTPGNYGDTGGAATHAHTNQTVTMSAPSGVRGAALGTNTGATDTHTHSLPTVNTVAATSSNPAYRELKLIKYDAGIPNIIPAGAITIFDDSPGIPTTEIIPGGAFDPYWSQYTAQNNQMVRVNTTATGTGGSDTHTHSVTWTGSFGASSGTTSTCLVLTCNAPNVSPNGHTHTAPGATTSDSASTLPPYIGSLMAKANADTATLSTGITSMFTGDPGSGWIIHSSVGGKYYHKFIRPQGTYSEAGGGSSSHTHAATGTSGAAGGTNVAANNGSVAALGGHTHDLTATFYTGTSDPNYTGNNDYFLPEYFDVIIAEKVDFKLEAYRWFEDSNNENVTDPWSVLDVALSTAIPTLPTAYKPPNTGDELRLRVRILVNNNTLNVGEVSYKLQYKKGTDSSCSTGVGGTDWFDVGVNGGGSTWTFALSGVTDGTTLSTSQISSSVMQVYAKSNPTASNPNSVPAGQTMEYDFHIYHSSAEGATWYSFRVVEDTGVPNNGLLLSEYSACPTLVTKPQSANQLRHGEFFESNGTKRGFTWAD